MTRQPHLKARVRARMARTGERYADARAHVLGAGERADESVVEVGGVRHFPGVHPATTALRVLAHHAGVRGPEGEPVSEALQLVVGGGIGAGLFTFRYEREDVSTLFVAGRHRWDDDRGFLEAAARRLGLDPTVVETGSPRTAEAQLADATAGGPAIAWVDLAELGTRGFPAEWSGGGYHVVTVYGRDERTGNWLVGDLARDPISVAPEILARSRARIAKQRHRVLTVRRMKEPDLAAAVRAGIAATHAGLERPRSRAFSLDAFATWADRLSAARGRDAWATIFPRGRLLFDGLRSIDLFVERYGTGGGLLRPLFADGLIEAAAIVDDARVADVAGRYATLGRMWADLAAAALPDDVPLFAEARRLQAQIGNSFGAGGEGGPTALGPTWARLDELRAAAAVDFPLDEAATAAIRDDLAARVRAIHAAERAALVGLRGAVG